MFADGSERVFKLLSRDPENYDDAPIEALRRIVEEANGVSIPRGTPLDLSCIGKYLILSVLNTKAHMNQSLCVWAQQLPQMHYWSGKDQEQPCL